MLEGSSFCVASQITVAMQAPPEYCPVYVEQGVRCPRLPTKSKLA